VWGGGGGMVGGGVVWAVAHMDVDAGPAAGCLLIACEGN